MARKHRKCKGCAPKASQKSVCKMLREASSDEKKGHDFYRRLQKKLPKHNRKKVISEIAGQEEHHKKRIGALEKELMC